MNISGILTFSLLVLLVSGCQGNKKELSELKEKNELENLEYTVYNQTLSLLGENILFNQNDYIFLKKYEIARFNERYDIEDKTKLFERFKKEQIDTSRISLSKIEFLIVPDSLDEKGSLERTKFKIEKINHPEGIILIKGDDEIRKLDFFIKSIRLSRIVFNDIRTKAEFEVGIVRGLMNGSGINVKCELKNGTWVIVETKTTWLA